MAFFEEFEDFMPDTVKLHLHSGYNQAGDMLQASESEVSCYIEGGAQKVVDADGIERVSQARVYLASITGVTPETLVTLPLGHHPRERLPIISVMRMSDEEGPSHMVLFV
jgi:hypothetical protein